MEKKSVMLKVMGILCIVFGGISLITAILAKGLIMGIIEGLNELGGTEVEASVTKLMSSFSLVSTLGIVSAIIMLAAGILGVVFASKPDKAMIVIILGVLMIILEIVPIFIQSGMASTIKEIMGDADGAGAMAKAVGPNFLFVIIGLVIPVLYLIGGIKLKGLASEQ